MVHGMEGGSGDDAEPIAGGASMHLARAGRVVAARARRAWGEAAACTSDTLTPIAPTTRTRRVVRLMQPPRTCTVATRIRRAGFARYDRKFMCADSPPTA